MMDKDYADDRKFLNCLLKNIVILETMEQCKEYDSQMICTALARKLSGNIRLILFIMILCCLGIHVKYSQGPRRIGACCKCVLWRRGAEKGYGNKNY